MLVTTTMAAPGIVERPLLDDHTDTGNAGEWIVTVYNNEVNTWDQVVGILMEATGCDEEEADMETWEIDRLGASVVHHASQEECEVAAKIIAKIGIRVEASAQP